MSAAHVIIAAALLTNLIAAVVFAAAGDDGLGSFHLLFAILLLLGLVWLDVR